MFAWIRNRIQAKTMLLVVAVVALVFSIMAVFADSSISRLIYAQGHNGSIETAELVRIGVTSAYYMPKPQGATTRGTVHAVVQKQLEDFGHKVTGLRLFVVDPKLQVVFATTPKDRGNHIKGFLPPVFIQRIIEEAIRSGRAHNTPIRYALGGQHFLATVQPVLNDKPCHTCHLKDRRVLGAMVVRRSIDDMLQRQNRLELMIFLAAVGGILLTTLLLYPILAELLLKPIRQVYAVAKAVSKGDLRHQAPVKSRDELGELVRVFNLSVERIKKVVQTLIKSTQILTSHSSQLTDTSRGLTVTAKDMSQQSDSVASSADAMSNHMGAMATSMEEMTASIREIARNSTTAAELNESTSSAARANSDKIHQLSRQAQEIGKVVEIINSIAEHTKLLALNATIEAARAGEAGRGFAVVANEIKELANETRTATEEVSIRIEAIQKNSADVAQAVAAITQSTSQLQDFSASIASAVEEQSATTNEIAENVVKSAAGIKDITAATSETSLRAKETLVAAEQTHQTADDLNRVADEIMAIVRSFKVGDADDDAPAKAEGPKADGSKSKGDKAVAKPKTEARAVPAPQAEGEAKPPEGGRKD